MQRKVFLLLARLNKVLLPKFYKRDMKKLRPWEKAIIGYKLWVVKKVLP